MGRTGVVLGPRQLEVEEGDCAAAHAGAHENGLPHGAEEDGAAHLLAGHLQQLEGLVVELAALLLEARQHRHDEARQAGRQVRAQRQEVPLEDLQDHRLPRQHSCACARVRNVCLWCVMACLVCCLACALRVLSVCVLSVLSA